jgi:hypothetical protein
MLAQNYKFIMICIILFITNPFNNIIEINNYNKSNNSIWKQLHHDISNYFIINSDDYYNFYCISIKIKKSKIKSIYTNIINNYYEYMRIIFNHNNNRNKIIINHSYEYTAGIFGFWIESSYWYSSFSLLLFYHFLYLLIFDYHQLKYLYSDYIILIIVYIYFSQEYLMNFQSSLISNDKIIKFYVFIITIIIILNLYILDTYIFHNYHNYNHQHRLSSSSLLILYSITSSIIIYTCLISTEYDLDLYSTWLSYQLSYSQLSLLLIVQQVVNLDRYGIAGSISGLIFYNLQQNGILNF